jgi:ABC-type antimicrobial peptide transport system permease subunit
MIQNYFKTAWRSLWKNKFYSIINISGLAIGLSSGIMLLLWVQNELSYDRFNENYPQIYNLSSHFISNGAQRTWTGVPGPLAVYAKSFSEVKSTVRIQNSYGTLLSDKDKNKMFDGNRVAAVDTGFFSMFTFDLLEGNKTRLFTNINSIIVTRSTAQKFFGDESALGKIIRLNEEYFTVTAVMKDFPQNSSFKFDAIVSMTYAAQKFTNNGGNGNWKTIDEDLGNFRYQTYVQLTNGADPVKVGEMFTNAYKKARNGESDATFKLQNLADTHLVGADGNNSALRLVEVFTLVVFLLLSIASINYVNLSTARSLIRAKEVSIRKMIGANRKQLFFQFIIETTLLFCFASFLAIVLMLLLTPLYNNISGNTLSLDLSDLNVWKVASLAILGTLIASSIYPAILLSSFKPLESLKGKIVSGLGMVSLRKGLVVFQFAVSVVLLICTFVMSHQLHFVMNKDLGYDKSYVFSVPLTQEVVDHIDAVMDELKKDPAILNTSLSDAYDFSNVDSSTSDLDWATKPPKSNMIISQISIDKDFIPTMKINFVEGGNFTATPADSSSFILNKTAVQKMGLKAPYVGQQISFHDKKGTIIGVVEDFNYQSLKEQIAPLIFFTFWNRYFLYIRTSANNAHQGIVSAEKQFKKYAGDVPFSYQFLDKNFEELYKSEKRTGTLFNVFAGIAIFISCMGLFGLATFTAQVKIKEIGIRKVLGASVTGIIQLISKDFLKLIIIAIILSIPAAWWIMNKWLQGFAYRVDVSLWVFVLSAIIAILTALLAVSFQSYRAAIANPVKSLRTE